jgi:hypothetical protein
MTLDYNMKFCYGIIYCGTLTFNLDMFIKNLANNIKPQLEQILLQRRY